MTKRGLQYFTLSEIEPRVWFMLTGCNFSCKGCFRPARDEGGTQLTAAETLERMERACLDYYGKLPVEAMITGGEPTLDKEYLVTVVKGLKEKGFEKIVLMTNGYTLGADGGDDYVHELEEAGLNEAHVDLKAFSEDVHESYTGKSNKPVLRAIETLHASGIELLVQTVYMPGLVDDVEIELIAQFLASVSTDIRYRINPFVPIFAYEKATRRPTLGELERAYSIASAYLPNAIISRSCYREYPTPPPQKTWITVYPDLTAKQRSMKDQMQDRLSWLSHTRSCESKADWQKEEWDFTLRDRLVGISETSVRQQSGPREEKGSGSIKVKFPLSLHALTKTRWTDLDCDGSTTIEEVMRRLIDHYGDKFKETVLDVEADNDGLKIKRSFNVYLNGMNIKNLQGTKTEVQGNDELIILSWVSGG